MSTRQWRTASTPTQLWLARYASTAGSAEAAALAVDASNHNIYGAGTIDAPDGFDQYATVAYSGE